MLPKAKKRFGQHFLTDRHYIDRIVNAIAPKPEDVMIEIGPGPGAMTAPLIAKLHHLHAVEIDRDLAAVLRARFPADQFTLHEENVLEFDFGKLTSRFRCVGNLPYNISTPFLFHLAGFAEQLIDATFMLQKEVVDRMVAAPDTKAYGRLSVMLQYRFQMKRLFDVPPGAFTPPPKVDSAIVHLVPLPAGRPAARDDSRFAALVTAGFGQRRKTLANTLKLFMPAEAILAQGIDPRRRGETLSVTDFIALADASLAFTKKSTDTTLEGAA
ncbi:MAG: 16S rRNA (adenine(1518)-N(6)/adenine(1519)-N(6))-dimethyltransferase RsmA [Betaproteobacteria bacterium]|nr:16S rRNA (adenine(1518)-N(6)/adenine(1519)-N(6))-dimethyltransferase RsmA [Betaproteobacteria bacterium]